MSENQYAVWEKEDGSLFFNPNCYFTVHAVGDVVNGSKCVFVGPLADCSAMVEAQSKDESSFLDDLCSDDE